jgi:hypothetical protein
MPIILSTKLKNRFSPDYVVTLRNITINGDKRGCSGFISHGDAIVYVNTEYFSSLGYMYRTAESRNDYTGGVNRWAKDLDSLVAGVVQLLDEQIKHKEYFKNHFSFIGDSK